MEEKTKKADQQNSNKLEFNLDCIPTIDKVSEPKVLNYNLKKRTNKRVDESWSSSKSWNWFQDFREKSDNALFETEKIAITSMFS